MMIGRDIWVSFIKKEEKKGSDFNKWAALEKSIYLRSLYWASYYFSLELLYFFFHLFNWTITFLTINFYYFSLELFRLFWACPGGFGSGPGVWSGFGRVWSGFGRVWSGFGRFSLVRVWFFTVWSGSDLYGLRVSPVRIWAGLVKKSTLILARPIPWPGTVWSRGPARPNPVLNRPIFFNTLLQIHEGQ